MPESAFTLPDTGLEAPGDWSDFESYLQEQDLSVPEQEVKVTHWFMRYQTSLSSGAVRDYVKALNTILVGGEQPGDVSNGSAAMKQYRKALEFENTKNSQTTGEDRN